MGNGGNPKYFLVVQVLSTWAWELMSFPPGD